MQKNRGESNSKKSISLRLQNFRWNYRRPRIPVAVQIKGFLVGKKFTLIFDEPILKQLKKAAKDKNTELIVKKLLDRLEIYGPISGNLLDVKIWLYELKNKHPPIRIYFKHQKETNEIYVLEYEMKTSEKKQSNTISNLRKKLLES